MCWMHDTQSSSTGLWWNSYKVSSGRSTLGYWGRGCLPLKRRVESCYLSLFCLLACGHELLSFLWSRHITYPSSFLFPVPHFSSSSSSFFWNKFLLYLSIWPGTHNPYVSDRIIYVHVSKPCFAPVLILSHRLKAMGPNTSVYMTEAEQTFFFS